MTAAAFAGSSIDANLADLTAALRAMFPAPNPLGAVVCEIGLAASVAVGSPPRVVWEPPQFGEQQILEVDQQPEGGHASYAAHSTWTVHAWGADFGATEALMGALVNACNGSGDQQGVFTANACKFGPAGYVGETSPTGSASFVWVGKVTLIVPIYDQIWKTGALAPAAPAGSLTTPPGYGVTPQSETVPQ